MNDVIIVDGRTMAATSINFHTSLHRQQSQPESRQPHPETATPFLKLAEAMTTKSVLLSFCLLASCMPHAEAWILPSANPILHASTRVHAALPEGYQEMGDFLIQKTAKEEFGTENIDIDWKPGRIIVTVKGNVYLSNPNDVEEEETIMDDDDIPEDFAPESPSPEGAVDVTQLARAINNAFNDDGIGLRIAETHEIEVTTPGASNLIQGDVMFEAYKGFEVFCDFQDPKTKKVKKIEGRLVERNDEHTIINIKGRMKKIKNDMVLSVALPKAKKEKGAA